ncbi:MAG: MrcB family domain-containing protein [Candidatus Tyrphobacter sp.]
MLTAFASEHPKTFFWRSPSRPKESWVAVEARSALRNALPPDVVGLSVSASAGKGEPSKTPWVAVMRDDITTTPQSGVYIVYLLAPDKKVSCLRSCWVLRVHPRTQKRGEARPPRTPHCCAIVY